MQVLQLSETIKKMKEQIRAFRDTSDHLQSIWESVVSGKESASEDDIRSVLQPSIVDFQEKIKSSGMNKEKLKEHGLPTNGKKEDLIARLLEVGVSQ